MNSSQMKKRNLLENADLNSESGDYQMSSISNNSVNFRPWTVSESELLLKRIANELPIEDDFPLGTRLKKILWDKIAFAGRSPHDCFIQWKALASHVRDFRIMSEMVTDVRSWLKRQPRNAVPAARAKYQRRKPRKVRPETPRKPENAFLIFRKKVIPKFQEEDPNIHSAQVSRRASALYQQLPLDEKVQLLQHAAEKFKDFYAEKLGAVRTRPETNGESINRDKPRQPLRPFDFFCREEKLKLDGKTKITKTTLTSMWTKLPGLQKARFIKLAVDDWKRYKKTNEKTNPSSCSIPTKDEVSDFQHEHPKSPIKKRRSTVSLADRKQLELAEDEVLLVRSRPEVPLIPHSGYQLFLSEYRLQEHPTNVMSDNGNWLFEAAATWKSFCEDDRRRFKERIDAIWNNYYTAAENYLKTISDDELREKELKVLGLRIDADKLTQSPDIAFIKETSPKKGVADEVRPQIADQQAGINVLGAAKAIFVMEKELYLQTSVPGMTFDQIRQQLEQEFNQLPEDVQTIYLKKAQSLAEIF